jgi:ComF family protein
MKFYPLASKIWAAVVAKTSKCQIIGNYCLLCARLGQPEIDLCQACESLLIKDRDDDVVDCRESHTPLFTRTVAAYQYAFPLDNLIKQVKYRRDRQPGRLFGTLLARCIASQAEHAMPQILIPMPLFPARQIERGFNQAHDIARWCGRKLGIEVNPHLVKRLVDTGSMAGLSRAERQLNILGAFRGSDKLAGKHVAIIDDVLTTGSSSRELAREIYDCGAESVELWTLARTSRRRGAL